MISFRYHLVSIVAVFLALALGVVMGTTVVKRGLIEQLRSRTDTAVKATRVLENEVSKLQKELRTANAFAAEVLPRVIDGQLVDRPVVLVTMDGVDPAEVDGIRQSLGQAGASVLGILAVQARMALPDEGSRIDLAGILSASTTDQPAALTRAASQALGSRLATGPQPGGLDVLQQLVSANFLALRGGSAGIPQIGGPGQAVLFLGGGASPPSYDPVAVSSPAVAALLADGNPVGLAETTASGYPFVASFRSDGAVDGRVLTVDDAETIFGQAAVVLGLRDLWATPGKGGDYGRKAGASNLIPTP